MNTIELDGKTIKVKGNGTRLSLKKKDIYSIAEIHGLEALPVLEKLNLSKNNLSTIEGLDHLTALTSLDLSENHITEIRGLDTLTALESLDLSGNEITEIKGLRNLMNLKTLRLEKNPLTKMTGLKTLVNMENLYLGKTQIREVADLEKMSNLGTLRLPDKVIIPEGYGLSSTQYYTITKDGCSKWVKYCQDHPAPAAPEEASLSLPPLEPVEGSLGAASQTPSQAPSQASSPVKSPSLSETVELTKRMLQLIDDGEQALASPTPAGAKPPLMEALAIAKSLKDGTSEKKISRLLDTAKREQAQVAQRPDVGEIKTMLLKALKLYEELPLAKFASLLGLQDTVEVEKLLLQLPGDTPIKIKGDLIHIEAGGDLSGAIDVLMDSFAIWEGTKDGKIE